MAGSPIDAAIRKGRLAFESGQQEADCPYRDKRKHDGRLTFSRAWRNAWLDGYRSAKSEIQKFGGKLS